MNRNANEDESNWLADCEREPYDGWVVPADVAQVTVLFFQLLKYVSCHWDMSERVLLLPAVAELVVVLALAACIWHIWTHIPADYVLNEEICWIWWHVIWLLWAFFLKIIFFYIF